MLAKLCLIFHIKCTLQNGLQEACEYDRLRFYCAVWLCAYRQSSQRHCKDHEQSLSCYLFIFYFRVFYFLLPSSTCYYSVTAFIHEHRYRMSNVYAPSICGCARLQVLCKYLCELSTSGEDVLAILPHTSSISLLLQPPNLQKCC